MKFIKNERGIALVMVLILSLICLAIVSAMLFMITQGTQTSGSLRIYRTTREASMGGIGLSKEYLSSNIGNAVNGISLATTLGGFALRPNPGTDTSPNNCLSQKLSLGTSSWSNCGAEDKTIDPTVRPDMRFDLGNYRTFAKIVDAVGGGNSEDSALVTGGGELAGGGYVNPNTALKSPPHVPWLYTIEIQSENSANPSERSRMSVLYAY